MSDSLEAELQERLHKKLAAVAVVVAVASTLGGGVWYASGLMTRQSTYSAIKERCVGKEAFAMLKGEVDSNRRHLGRIERKIDANSKKLDRLIWARAHGRKRE